MITDALPRSRRVLAYGLLLVAALYFASALSLMFKNGPGAAFDFAEKSASFGYLFASPYLVFSLLGAVLLVTGRDDAAQAVKRVALVASVIASLAMALAVITFLSGLTAAERPTIPFGGVLGAGRYVAILLGLAHLLALALTAWFALTVVRSVPHDAAVPVAPSDLAAAQAAPWQLPQTGTSSIGSSEQAGWGERFQGQPASMWGVTDENPEPDDGTPPRWTENDLRQRSDQPTGEQKWWQAPPQ